VHEIVEPAVVEPLTVGSAVLPGAVGAAVTVTAPDVAFVEPPAVDAVTTQRTCTPTAWLITYVELVAPPIVEPFAVHAYAYPVGTGVQLPVVHESVEPTVVVPLTAGSAVFVGAATVTVVAAEVAPVEPPAFVAVTTQRSCTPTASTITYVGLVAPEIVEPFAVHAYV
jgi:hypothetical protein